MVPFFAQRNSGGIYELTVQPALSDFPSRSKQADTDQLNQLIEVAVQQHPSQYLWMHQRFKDMPKGGNRYGQAV